MTSNTNIDEKAEPSGGVDDRPSVCEGEDHTIRCKAIETCLLPSVRHGAEQVISFRKPHQVGVLLDMPLRSTVLADEVLVPKVSCVPITKGSISLAMDINILQRWCFQEIVIDDLASSIGLAPGETMTFKVKRSQRTKIDSNSLTSASSMESFESSLSDKEVMNVTRTSAKSMQWEASANASIRVGVFNAGASGKIAGDTQRSAEEALEQLNESTEKSSRQLKLLQKLEVAKSTESLFESEQIRTVENPYRDRPLQLNFFELSKQYRVINELDAQHPFDFVVVFEVDELRFDRSFVLANLAFLDGEMLDRSLWSELQGDLRSGTVRPGEDLQWFALQALSYLFEKPGVFDMPESSDGGTKAEVNDPALSFGADPYGGSGFKDALLNNFGDGFAALNVYFHLYKELTAPDSDELDGEMAIRLALTLADYIGPRWSRLAKGEMKDMLKKDSRSEAIRRIPGFLALVEGGVRSAGASGATQAATPEVSEAEDGVEDAEISHTQDAGGERPDSVIARVVEHLRCNRSFYIKSYLNYASRITFGFAQMDMIRDIREWAAENAPTYLPRLLEMLDLQRAFQDGNYYVVPLRRPVELDEIEAIVLEMLTDRATAAGLALTTEVKNQILRFTGNRVSTRETTVKLPADGYYLEAVEGHSCMITEIPPNDVSLTASGSLRIGDQD